AQAELLKDAVALNEAGTVLLDRKNGRTLVKADVCLRRGPLEMLLCLPQTKEHESILKYEGDARTLHAALVAAGLEPGAPVSFDPRFAPPKGPILEITLYWTDENGERRQARGQDWVRTSTDKWYERPLAALPPGMSLPEDLELRYDRPNGELLWYGQMSEADRDRALALSTEEEFQQAVRSFFKESQPQPLTADFVFAGSYFYDRPTVYSDEGEVLETVRTYAAEGGEVICVANFPSATIDIAEQSSADNSSILYEAATEAIPPFGTEVLIVFAEKPAGPPTPKPEGQEADVSDGVPAKPAEPAAPTAEADAAGDG
ncbi:MAG: YdjY domain-containing protein, partial [Planctomycetota bacterium]